MASFPIHCDNSEKENPGKQNIKEKSALVVGAKQPLAVIGGKEKAMPQRANLTVLTTNNNYGNVPRKIASPSAAFRSKGNVKVEENAGFGGGKKTNVLGQVKPFSVYEDNAETQVQLHLLQQQVGNKENQPCDAKKFDMIQKDSPIVHGYDMVATPMSVTDVLSPMSVDLSMVEVSSNDQPTDSSLAIDTAIPNEASLAAAVAAAEKVVIPRNDRQRFFEVVDYQQDILENFRENEKKHRPKPHYMRRQTDINHSMRTILVDWLVEVSEEYKLDGETLYLAISYLDRFLSQMSVKRAKLQLVGTAAIYIASKYEEIFPPDVGEFVFLTDDSYTKAQVLRMEQVFLKILSFNLCTPTPYVFINTYAVMCDMPKKLKHMTMFICELSLLEGDTYIQYLPSILSSAGLAFARHLFGMEMWSPQLEEITTYSLDNLKDLVLKLAKTHKATEELTTQAIREKYNKDKYTKVAAIESIELSENEIDLIIRNYNASSRCKTEVPPGMNENVGAKVNLFYKF